MDYVDARRLTGPNVLMIGAGSVLDLQCEADEIEAVAELWTAAVKPMLEALGWGQESLHSRSLIGGVSLAFSAPIDALYAATEVNEYAWRVLEAQATGGEAPVFATALADVQTALDQERNARLQELASSSAANGVQFLWDDDDVSIGLGRGMTSWPIADIPAADEIRWSEHHDIPVGLVTGTNGKTTTVRLATHILRHAGHNVGVSCTDWVAVNDHIVDRDDWSGPGGARLVLRQPDVGVAILECARGGLLRRGLGVEHANVALITNIAEDHLGDFGSRSLQELLDIKWVISQGVQTNGLLILNADDARLVAKAANYPGRLAWFSLYADSPLVAMHATNGGTAFVLEGENLTRIAGATTDTVCKSSEIPITLGGAAMHNVANALAAAALTDALGASLEQIRDGLRSVTQDTNPGRCNIHNIDGVTVLVDFAHNPAAMQSLFDMARALPAKRRLLAFGQAGDRTDLLIEELAHDAWAIGLDAVVVSELADYRRGRAAGEVFGLIRDELLRCGALSEQIHHFDEEMESLQFALSWAREGDLIIFLDLGRDPAVHERLAQGAAELGDTP